MLLREEDALFGERIITLKRVGTQMTLNHLPAAYRPKVEGFFSSHIYHILERFHAWRIVFGSLETLWAEPRAINLSHRLPAPKRTKSRDLATSTPLMSPISGYTKSKRAAAILNEENK